MNFISNLFDRPNLDYVEYKNCKPNFLDQTTFWIPTVSRINTWPKAAQFVSEIVQLGYDRFPKVSEKQLVKITQLLVRDPFNSKFHLMNLEKLEKCFHLSEEFNLEKAKRIFLTHIKSLQENQKFDVNQILDEQTGLMPVGFAAMSKSPALLNALIQAGGLIFCGQAKIEDPHGVFKLYHEKASPVHLLLENYDGHKEIYDGHKEINEAFVESILNPKYYQFPQEMLECINILHQGGCDFNSASDSDLLQKSSKDKSVVKRTPIWQALTRSLSFVNYQLIMKALVNAKADIDSINENGWTPLQCATKNNWDWNDVKFLIELGADLFVEREGYFAYLPSNIKITCAKIHLTVLDLYTIFAKCTAKNARNLEEIMKNRFPDHQKNVKANVISFIAVNVLADLVLEYLWEPNHKHLTENYGVTHIGIPPYKKT